MDRGLNPFARRLTDLLALKFHGPRGIAWEQAVAEINHKAGTKLCLRSLRKYAEGKVIPNLMVAEGIARGLRVHPGFWFLD